MTRRKKPFFSISYFVAQLNMNTNLLLENIKNFQAHSRLGPCFHRFWTIFATNSDVFLLCTVFINLWKQTRKTFLFFFLGHSHFIRNCKEQISQFWQNRDFSRGWAKQLSLPNHYNTSLETLINWKWGEFYRNNSPIKQTNKMTNH